MKRVMNMKNNICIDIGGSYIKYAVFSENILNEYDLVQTDRTNILNQLKDLIRKIIDEMQYEVSSIGISIPGAVDTEKGLVIHAINLNLYNFNLVNYLKKYFNFNIFIISDRDAGLIGCLKSENFKYTKNVLGISWGTGIALSIFQDNKLYKSTNKFAPEFGHTYISDNKKYICFCGKKGCLNAISGAQAMRNTINDYLQMKGDNIEKSLIEVKQNKDEKLKQIFKNSIYYLSKAISNIYSTLDPECVFIWGGMSDVAQYFYEDIKNIVNDSVHKSLKDKNKIIISKYGRKSALYGMNSIANGEV